MTWLDLDTIPQLFEPADLDARTARQCGLRVTRADSGAFLRARPATKPSPALTREQRMHQRRREEIAEREAPIVAQRALPGMESFDRRICARGRCGEAFRVLVPAQKYCTPECYELNRWEKKTAPGRVRGELTPKKGKGTGSGPQVGSLFEGVTT